MAKWKKLTSSFPFICYFSFETKFVYHFGARFVFFQKVLDYSMVDVSDLSRILFGGFEESKPIAVTWLFSSHPPTIEYDKASICCVNADLDLIWSHFAYNKRLLLKNPSLSNSLFDIC